jgi:hypothetical protein
MIEKDELQNRQERPMRGQAEADAAIARMKGQSPKPDMKPAEISPAPKPADELTELRARILKAHSVAPPSGDNQFAQGCFIRGRDAALGIIDGEAPG